MNKYFLSCCLFILLIPFNILADDNKDNERIKGVSDFLVDRAKQNYLYIFEQRLKDSEILKCYLPSIYSHVSEGDLRLLLLSRQQWSESIKKDMQALTARSLAKTINESIAFKALAMDTINTYLEITPYLTIEYQGNKYPLNVIPIQSTQELRDLINGFYTDLNELNGVFLKIDTLLNNPIKHCATPLVSLDDMITASQELQIAAKGLKKFRRHVKTHLNRLHLNKEMIEEQCKTTPNLRICSLKTKLKEEWLPSITEKLDNAAGKTIVAIAVLKKLSNDLDKAETNTEKALIAIKYMRDAGMAEESIEKYKRHLLFFAELSEAQGSLEVQEILTAYTLPPVNFGVKREPHEGHFLVNSYFGYSYGKVDDTNAFGDENKHGIYAPVGLEYSKGTKGGGSLNLMISPFDFGYPISLKLNGVEQDVALEDVVAPSLLLSYGLPNYPLAIGIAYQKGRTDEQLNQTEKRILFVIAFDMPLLTLY
jgi:hypothetical protein